MIPALRQSGAQPLHGTRVFAPRGSSLTGRFAEADPLLPSATGLAVSRRILDQHLVDAARAAGAEVRELTTVEELVYDAGAVAGAVVRDARGDRTTMRSRLVIGADGLRSVVARRIGRRRHGTPSRVAFVAHVAGVPGLDGLAEMHVGPEGYVGLNRIGADLANVALVVPRSRAHPARGRPTEFFFELLDRFPGVSGRIRAERLVREVSLY